MNGCKIPEMTDLVIGLKIQLLKRPGLENPYQRITISGPTRFLSAIAQRTRIDRATFNLDFFNEKSRFAMLGFRPLLC